MHLAAKTIERLESRLPAVQLNKAAGRIFWEMASGNVRYNRHTQTMLAVMDEDI